MLFIVQILQLCRTCNLYCVAQHISTKLETGSLVQFGNPVQYGVIKRIETAVDTLEEIAEVETVSYMNVARIYVHLIAIVFAM